VAGTEHAALSRRCHAVIPDDRLASDGETSACESLTDLFSRLDLDASTTLTVEEYEAFPYLWRRYVRTFEDMD
jgi:hypothetical protein